MRHVALNWFGHVDTVRRYLNLPPIFLSAQLSKSINNRTIIAIKVPGTTRYNREAGVLKCFGTVMKKSLKHSMQRTLPEVKNEITIIILVGAKCDDARSRKCGKENGRKREIAGVKTCLTLLKRKGKKRKL